MTNSMSDADRGISPQHTHLEQGAAIAATEPPNADPGPAGHAPRGPVWIGLASILAGVAGFVVALIPAEYSMRTALMAAGIVIAAVGAALAIVSLRKAHHTGLSVTGLVVSGLVFLLMSALLVLGIIAEHQIQAMIQRDEERVQAEQAEEQAAQDALLERSAWMEEALAGAARAEPVVTDAALLTQILSDPDAHGDDVFLVGATMPLPLTSPGLEAEGLCVTHVTLSPADGSAAEGITDAAIVDRGTAEHCPLTDAATSAEAGEGLLDGFMTDYQLRLVPSGVMQVGTDDLPQFMLVSIEE